MSSTIQTGGHSLPSASPHTFPQTSSRSSWELLVGLTAFQQVNSSEDVIYQTNPTTCWRSSVHSPLSFPDLFSFFCLFFFLLQVPISPCVCTREMNRMPRRRSQKGIKGFRHSKKTALERQQRQCDLKKFLWSSIDNSKGAIVPQLVTSRGCIGISQSTLLHKMRTGRKSVDSHVAICSDCADQSVIVEGRNS